MGAAKHITLSADPPGSSQMKLGIHFSKAKKKNGKTWECFQIPVTFGGSTVPGNK
jgi:hypothetical protein